MRLLLIAIGIVLVFSLSTTNTTNEPFKWIDAKGSVHIIKNAIGPEMLRKRSPANIEIKKLPFHEIKRIKILDHEKLPLRKKSMLTSPSREVSILLKDNVAFSSGKGAILKNRNKSRKVL